MAKVIVKIKWYNVHKKFLPRLGLGILWVLNKYHFPFCWWLSILLRQERSMHYSVLLLSWRPASSCISAFLSLVLCRIAVLQAVSGPGPLPWPGPPLVVSPAPSLSVFVTVRLHSFLPLEAPPFFLPCRNFMLWLYFPEYCSLWPNCFSLPES